MYTYIYIYHKTIQWLGRSDKWSVWGIHIPYRFMIFPIQWGAVWSYLYSVSQPSNS